MKNRFFNYNLAFVFLIGVCFKANAQNIQVEAKLQQYTIRIGDQTKLFLSVHQPAAEKVNFPRLTDTIISKVQIVDSRKPDTTRDKNDPGNITVIQAYTITSFDAGSYILPSFAFGTSGGVVKSNELTLEVATVKVDTTKAIYDIKQPLVVSYTFFDWLRDNWYLVVLPIVAILLIVWLTWYLIKRRKETPVVEVMKPGRPPHEIALDELRKLSDKKLWQAGEVKRYHSELSDIIREYLESRFAIKAHEQTSDEIFAGLRFLSITKENKEMLRQILMLADLAKFAKETPLPPDNQQSMYNALNFVIQTQPAEPIENAKGGNGYV